MRNTTLEAARAQADVIRCKGNLQEAKRRSDVEACLHVSACENELARMRRNLELYREYLGTLYMDCREVVHQGYIAAPLSQTPCSNEAEPYCYAIYNKCGTRKWTTAAKPQGHFTEGKLKALIDKVVFLDKPEGKIVPHPRSPGHKRLHTLNEKAHQGAERVPRRRGARPQDADSTCRQALQRRMQQP